MTLIFQLKRQIAQSSKLTIIKKNNPTQSINIIGRLRQIRFQSLLKVFQIKCTTTITNLIQEQSLAVMKKMQNYLMKPEELKKKLENPKFRSTFLEWSKCNISLSKDQNNKPLRAKSPIENYQKSLNLHRKSTSVQDKQNQKPNSSLNKNLSSKTKLKVTSKQKTSTNRQQKQSPTAFHPSKKRQMSQSAASHNTKNYQSNRSLNKNYISSLSSKHRYNSCSSIMAEHVGKKNRTNNSLGHNDSMNDIKKKSPKEGGLKFELKYAYRTKQGVQITNPNKTNQDSLLIKTNLSSHENSSIFAVADGHGMYGHHVSQYLVKNLSKLLQQQAKKGKSPLIQSIPVVYNKLQQGLYNNPQVNASCSGSTLEIICANVGDSRAILARQIDKKNWEMIYLSQDHKPTVEGEKKRILKSGGKIHAFKDENGCPVGPQRVWLPNQNMQGLAMSRSFGDNISKPVGVTHIPEIINLKIDKRDRFVLIASDGVWQFITNQQVLQLLVPFYRDNKLEQACDALMKLAYERWTVEDKSIVDDITLILIFFEHQKDQSVQ